MAGKLKKTIGILAFQGDVIEHQRIFEKLGCAVFEVRSVADLDQVDALVIPGGESTVIGFFLEQTGLMQAIRDRVLHDDPKLARARNLAIWGTCAGAILLAKNIKANIVPPNLGLMDMTVERNAYGSQIDSFYTRIDIPDLNIFGLESAFIRAPIILSTQAEAKILAKHNGEIVLVQQGKLLASTFHPELTDDTRLHKYFLSLV